MPTVPRAEYEIHAKDKTKDGLNSANNNLTSLSSSLKNTFKGIATALAGATATLTGVALGINKLTDIYGKQEKAEIKLAAAAKNNPYFKSANVQNLFDYASSLQSISTFGDEALISLMSLGVNMGHTEETIKGVADAAINLAAGTGMALDSAFKQIYKTFGGFAGELGETIPAMKELTAEQLKNGAAVDLLKRQYGGMAEAVKLSVEGSKDSFANMFGDVLEDIGSAFAPLQKILYQKLTPVFNAIGKWFTDNSSKITNFFLHFGEIARLTFEYIKKALTQAFEWESVVKSFTAAWDFIKKRTVAAADFLWSVLSSIGNMIWVPLKAGFEWAVYGIKQVWAGMVNTLASGIGWFIENPINAIVVAFKSVTFAIGEAIEWVMNGLINLINGIIDGLNFVLKGAHDAQQALKHPFDKSKREEFQGNIGKLGEMKIDWLDPKKHAKLTANLDKFIIKTEDIPKPESSFKTIYENIRDTWINTLDEGKDFMTGLFQDVGELGGVLAEPFKIGFAGFTDEFISILERDLPPEAQSVVQKLKDALDIKEDKDLSWKAFSAYLKSIYDNIKKSFEGFISNIKTGFANIGKGLSNTGGFIKEAFENPKEAIAKAGFAFVAAIKGLANNSEKINEKLKNVLSVGFEGIKGAASSLFSFISDGIKGTDSFTQVMDSLKQNVKSLFEMFVSPLLVLAQPLIDSFIKITSVLLNALAPVIVGIGEIFKQLDPLFAALEPVIKQLGLLFEALLPIISSLVNTLVSVLVPVFDIFADVLKMITDVLITLQPVFDALFNMIATILQPIIEFIANILQTIAPVLDVIAQILVALAPVFTAIGEVLASVLTPILTFLANLLSAVLTPILQVFTGIMQVLTPIFNIFAIIMKALTPIFNVLLTLLNILLIPLQIFSTILEALNPVFQLLSDIITFITPVFELFAKIVDAASRPIEFIGDLFSWLGQGLKALGQTIWYLITFQWGKMGNIEWPGAFRSDAFTRPLIDTSSLNTQPTVVTLDTDLTNTNLPTASTYTGGGTGASYGTNNLTINVTINTDVIAGPEGIRDLTKMIDRELYNLRRQGLATAF